ncbi:H+/gluconate symporter [Thermosyntropha lipolytica DSM 11003]|uniref:H+/gluconate symporter n=1 Tax=Thermosyntropha lipolytica DSM 11003 TaxID=1123382 RepID=A0A1M5R7U0_9FIRM|nr:GntP family permease [Thermosyntropha lipolytica]SHH22382.1 H+/gluconate symporter [Thermosyntropha lipolytica DSM 11003]
MTGIMGIVIALVLLMYLAYRGISVLILAPLMALLAVLLSGDAPILATYTQVFMKATGNFIILYFPLFLLGAIFGKLMDDSGSAKAIANWIIDKFGAERSILAVVISCALLTYGGVSLFVVAFAVYPIAAALFRDNAIPKRLIPGTIALGAFTFTMTALPGTPAIQNAIPMPFFGTTPFAAPFLGIISAIVMFSLGMLWLNYQYRKAKRRGEGYGNHEDNEPSVDNKIRHCAEGEGFDVQELKEKCSPVDLPAFYIATLPIVLVIALNYLFSTIIIPSMDTSYLALEQYGQTDVGAVKGIWSIIMALFFSIITLITLNWKRFSKLTESLDSGANASVLPIFNTASLVGFGAVIASLTAFELIRSGVLGIGGNNPLISLALSVNILAGITGSASGGMSIALQTLGTTYVEMARDAGVSLELMHRVTSVATGGLDSLPHNGAVITLLAICKLTHKESYKDIFVVAVLAPLAALVVLITLGTLFGSF